MIYINNINVYNENTAHDLLHSFGMDRLDIEELKRILQMDEVEELEEKCENLKDDRDYYESSVEHLHRIMNEVLQLLDEMLEKQRIVSPREKLEYMRKMIYTEL